MRLSDFPIFSCFAGFCALSALATPAAAQDLFGYEQGFLTNTADAPYIDIEATGRTALGRGQTVSTLELDAPFTFYGNSFSKIRVSKNGYLSTDLSDPGTDSTPDIPLPAMASVGGGDRVYAGHCSLSNPAVGDSRVIYQYFGSSPHPHHTGGVHVITWLNYVKPGAPNDLLTFQVLLFDNTDVLIQFPDERYLDIDGSSSATVGIQNALAGSGFGGNVPSHSANGWLFEMPTVTVTSANDEETNNGLTSLREAVAMLTDGSSNRGGKIDFAPSVDGLTLTLLDLLEIPEPISIDASGLRNRFTITTAGANSFSVESLSHLQILGVDFPNVLVPLHQTAFQRPLFLHDCSVTNCTSAILGIGDVIATESTFEDNSANTIRCIDPQIPSVVRVEGCTLEDNDSIEYGGAINARGDYRVTVLDSTFVRNSAQQSGGAIAVREGESLDVRGCVFDRNTAQTNFGDADTPSFRQGGGAIFVADTPVDARSSLFEANSADDIDVGGGAPVMNGAAVHAENGKITLRESTIANHKGRAIVSNASLTAPIDGDITLSNATITGNTNNYIIALGTSGDLRLSHCTFARNTYTDSPAGPGLIFTNTDDLIRVSHCIFAENQLTGGDTIFDINSSSSPTFTNLGYNVLDTDQPQFDRNFRDQEATDPGLGSYGDHGGAVPTLPLDKNSPAVDTGEGGLAFPPPTDARGYPRVSSGSGGSAHIDVGAFEFQGGIQVTTATDEDLVPGDGISLREALAAIDEGGTITFAAGLDGETLFTGAPALPLIPADATIDASALPDGVTLNRSGVGDSYRTVAGGHANFRNITITGSRRIVTEGDATFTDCAFTEVGGGVIFAKGDLTMTRCLVEDSIGVTVQPNSGGANVTVSDCQFLHCENFALNLRASPNTATVTRTHIDATQAGTFLGSGAIRMESGELTIDRSTISNTTSLNDGSAIVVPSSSATVHAINSTISGNHTTGDGAAIWAGNSSRVNLEGCTVLGNFAEKKTGGVHIESGATLNLNHTILSGNRGADPGDFQNVNAPGSVTSDGYNISDLEEFDDVATDMLGVQPMLGPLSRYGGTMPVHAPLAISPIIDAGSTGSRPTDQRGFAGKVGTNLDIGAVEAGPTRVANGAASLATVLGNASDGDRIVFHEDLSGTEVDTSAIAGFSVGADVQIDATTLPGGIKFDAQGAQQLFDIADGAQVAMHGIDLEAGMNTGSGGGIYVGIHSALTFTHGSIGDCDTDGAGGGIYLVGGDDSYLNLLNATISRNSSEDDGGAIFLGGGHADIAYSTITGNIASSQNTCGIELFGSATVTALSSVIADNRIGLTIINFGQSNNVSVPFSEKFESLGYVVTDSAPTGQLAGVFGPTDMTSTDPDLGPVLLQVSGWAWVHTHDGTSPIHDANPRRGGQPPVLDARGFARRAQSGIDIGAYEIGGDILDTDGDRIPDYWEYRWGLRALDPSDATEDPDMDGTTNYEEFLGGSSPKSIDVPGPMLPVVTSVSRGSDELLYTVTGQTGVTFTVETSEDLENWSAVGTVTTQGFSNPVDASVSVRSVIDEFFVRFRLP